MKQWPEASEEDKAAIQRMLTETDWDAFWENVVKRSSKEMDAYARARAKSLETVQVFV